MEFKINTKHSRLHRNGKININIDNLKSSNENSYSLELEVEKCYSKQELDLIALLKAFKYIEDNIGETNERILILHRSKNIVKGFNVYIKKWLKNNFKTAKGGDVKHRELWKKIYSYIKRYNVLLLKKEKEE